MRLLIVEDEPSLARSLEEGLRRRGFAVDLAADGATGLDKASVNAYDVIVLDRDLPVLHGDDVCRRLVAASTPSRILMLTAASAIDDLVSGFELGADDYLAKPFQFAELVARVQALLRRQGSATAARLQHGEIVIDTGRCQTTRRGRAIALTPREFAVLELLVRAQGSLVSSEEMLEHAWDENADPFTTSVRVIVSRLRTKLGDPPAIATVIGRGYRLCGDD